MVLSFDGGGNDGTMRTFVAQRGGSRHGSGLSSLRSYSLDLGKGYMFLASLLAEVHPGLHVPHMPVALSLPGKLMALAARGRVVREWREPLRLYYQSFEVRTLRRCLFCAQITAVPGVPPPPFSMASAARVGDFFVANAAPRRVIFVERSECHGRNSMRPCCDGAGCLRGNRSRGEGGFYL